MAPTLALVRQRYTAFGGAERFLAATLETLAREGVALRLYTRAWPTQPLPFEVTRLDPPYLGSLWRDWSFARALHLALQRDRPALVQSHERIPGCAIYRAGDGVHATWLEQRQRGMNTVKRLAIAINPYHRYVLAAEAALFSDPRLRAVICNSRMVLEDIARRFPVPRQRLHLIYNAVDSARYSPALRALGEPLRRGLGLGSEAVVCLLLGSGYARKGLAAAIEALAGLEARFHLLVVGRERHLTPWKALAARLGVADRVFFQGGLEDPRPALGAADALVLPTLYDPCPNAVLEAMACGLPVVTSRQCGAAELLQEHGGGLVADARDVPALRAALASLGDADRRAALGRQARAAVQPLNAATMGAQLLALYHRLLDEDDRNDPPTGHNPGKFS